MRRIPPNGASDIDVPLSHGISHEGLVFGSGQVLFDGEGDVVGDDIGK